jgi:hypothetical protein
VVHCLHDLDDFEQTTVCDMRVRLYQAHTSNELFEVQALRSSQGVFLKEWNDPQQKIAPLADNELIQVFFVVVVSAIAVQTANSEELLH